MRQPMKKRMKRIKKEREKRKERKGKERFKVLDKHLFLGDLLDGNFLDSER